jgi:hypothetical protein
MRPSRKPAPSPSQGKSLVPSDAAAEARAESNQAAEASAIALKASQEASEAAAKAAQAAALAGSKPPSAATAHATPSPLLLSSSNQTDLAEQRDHASATIYELNRELQTIGHAHRNRDAERRVGLASKFLQGAQQAFADASYSEAESLAHKGWAMLAPLVPTTSGPWNRSD